LELVNLVQITGVEEQGSGGAGEQGSRGDGIIIYSLAPNP